MGIYGDSNQWDKSCCIGTEGVLLGNQFCETVTLPGIHSKNYYTNVHLIKWASLGIRKIAK